ncbi:MAG TPA: thiamine pyrophosphate-binding protein [Vicinamibacterales bacterium]|jgi:acetolactate synthase-1/2/3 large subunit|nr:acetolactate synthase [Acidobacteriota bacterium]HJO18405.1 thiamine pyrophosphate-binding protein [Vicinamibacterales bacterium]|tara:strand:+ start:1775 stop:3625 length:1851 start_codon:yes stop_codon:yes gene_type:complete
MKLADFVIDFLANKGIDKVFVVYGSANGDLVDAFTRTDKTQYVAVMHEQAGGFAAEGYAKVKGIPGVALATSGPGGMNLVTPIGNCFYDSVPCIFITGQVNSRFLRQDDSLRQIGFQETDIVSIVKPITKYATMVTDPKLIKFELEKAYHLCTSGRPGPVLIDFPMDVQKADIVPETLDGFPISERSDYREGNLRVVKEQVDRYVDDLVQSERPVLMIGGGVRIANAIGEVRELGRLLKIPCFPTWNALDVITSDFEYYGGRIGTYGGAGRNFGIQNSDLLLAIGSRISGRITGGNVNSFARGAKKYVVDVDLGLLEKQNQQVPFDENIHCDARAFIRMLIGRVKELQEPAANDAWNFSQWTTKVMAWKAKYDPVRPEFFEQKQNVHPYVFLRMLSRVLDSDAVIIGDCGGNIVVSNHSFETKHGQRYLTNNGNSPMGFSHAASMGCYLADPARQVICVIGDGGFNMNIQELQTFLNYDIKVKTFILNNHIYGITKAYQETNFEGRCEACGPIGYDPPDFIRICKAYDHKTFVINSHSGLEENIKHVLGHDGPVVCDVNCHEHHSYEPRIVGWKTPIEDMYPYLPRSEFKDNMFIAPTETWEHPEYPDVEEVTGED